MQSIDAVFRYQNYLFALAVAVPAALLLLMRPMASLHTRLKARKARELEAVNALIRAAPKDLEPDAMLGLETLLKRRERVQGAYTWPMNLAIVSRLVLYGIIPPAAWVAAAIVERLIGTLFGG